MDADLIVPLAGMLTGIILGYPVVRAVVTALERKARGGGSREIEGLRDEVQELRAAVEEMGGLRDVLAELEERVDFTERVLTRERGKPELPGKAD